MRESSGRMEPFRDRRDRAKSLPAEYAVSSAQYVSDVMDADVEARYFSFAVWTTARWGRDIKQLSSKIRKACQYACCDLFPAVSRHSLNRIPPDLALMAILVPAQKKDGVLHIHGFLRVPVKALSLGYTEVAVQMHTPR